MIYSTCCWGVVFIWKAPKSALKDGCACEAVGMDWGCWKPPNGSLGTTGLGVDWNEAKSPNPGDATVGTELSEIHIPTIDASTYLDQCLLTSAPLSVTKRHRQSQQ